MRIFWPEVQRTLKALLAIAIVSAVALPVAWGYGQQEQARAWRDIACTYRLRELEQNARVLGKLYRGTHACAELDRLGVPMDLSR